MNQTQSTTKRTPRYGLVPLRIGADLIVKGKDGKRRQFRALDKRRYANVECVLRCFTCKEDYESIEDLHARHEDQYLMVKNAETHLFAYWSDEQQAKESSDPNSNVYGLLSDEE